MSPSDEQLAQVFAGHAPYVFRVLRRLGVDAADVEDVCQEVFLVVHRRLPDFEGRAQLRTWIYGICLRCAARHRKRPHRRRELIGAELPELAIDPAQQRAVEQRQALERLDRALGELPETQREVYVLYELEDLSMAEVAEVVGCPLQTAYSRLHAARRQVLAAFAPAATDRKVV